MTLKFVIFGFFLSISSIHAATWVGGSGSCATTNTWNCDSNWATPATTPNGVDATAIFNDTAFNSPAFTVDITVGTITFASTDTYTISSTASHPLIFSASSSSAVVTLSSSGTLNFATAMPITLSSNLSITQNSTGDCTFDSKISGSKAITITGTGNVKFTNTSNDYSGGTTISSGTLIAEGNVLGSGGVTISSGTLEFDNANGASYSSSLAYTLNGAAIIDVTAGTTVTITGAIGGSGSLQKTDSGTLVLQPSSSNSYSGGTTISAGELHLASDAYLGNTSGSLNFAGGTLRVVTAAFSSARSGNISNNSSIFNTGGFSNTLSGNFSGTGALTIQGGGTLTLSGANSYTGGTTVTNTALVGNTNSLTGTITADAGSSVTFSQSFNGTYSGSLQGAAALRINGSGAVTLSGSSSLSGATTVQQGTLNITGSLASSAVTVNSGATLGGTGTVGATTINANGILDPGSGTSIGTLFINGNLDLSALHSQVNLDFTPTSTDLIAVTGTATLTGADLTITGAGGFYVPFSTYTVLTSTNALATTFASTSSTDSNFVITDVTYGANNVTLTIHTLSPFFNFPFSNQNTQSVGENINALSAANEIPTALLNIINTFLGQSNEAINAALDQMHPAPYSAYNELQEELGAQIISLFHRKPRLRCNHCSCNLNRIWVKPFGNSLNEKHHGKEFGFTANSGGIALGYDREAGENWVIGLGGAWNNTHLEWHSNHGHGIVNGVYGSLYTDYQAGSFYLGGAFLGGVDFYDTTRHINFFTVNEKAKSTFQGLDLIAQLTSAYYFGAPNALLYPYANFDFLYLQLPGFTESGAPGLNLDVKGRTSSTFRTEMGLAFQIQDTNYDETLCISPAVSIGWVNMFPIERPDFHSHFEGAQTSFTTYGWNQTWNLFALSFDLYIDYRCFTLGLEYNMEMSPDHETLLFNQNGDIRLEWNW